MSGSFNIDKEEFSRSLQSSFIEYRSDTDDRYTPRILTNDEETGVNVLAVLKQELRDCISFDFSVAFITDSGLQTIIPLLIELEERHIPGHILTSTYLDFNDPGALRTLLEYQNIDVRVYQGEHHAKGYFFNKDGLSTIIIGSSNLTQRALTCNKEWNVLFHTYEKGELLKETRREFNNLWNSESTVALSESWINAYEQHRHASRKSYVPSFRGLTSDNYHMSQNDDELFFADSKSQAVSDNVFKQLSPNKMQIHALEALDVLHSRAEPRALLVSATGTGKTYLSAFDVLRNHPKRVLFIAHRKRILAASCESFQRVLGASYTYAIYEGDISSAKASCLFAMVGRMSNSLNEFEPNAFDYIIIDEAHRTGANSYQKILEYFTAKFCLGMTATPNRTDGYDVYNLFNHVIAYRITLHDALDNEMLAPFHYFGIADLDINDEVIDDVSLFSYLTSEERVRHITNTIEKYTIDKKNRRGLIFCNRNDEAAMLSAMFNERGYRTIALSGASHDEERNTAIAQLEDGKLQYIFSVDILNEGIDIPSVNQIIMLRRTESAIVFIQQLGRGLRKLPNKEFTLVLDFIGNYQKNFLVPIALSGDRTYNKDNLRRVVKEGNNIIPGCSTISFDRISESRIFKALEQGRFSDAKLIRGEYEHLKQVLGHIPTLLDFDENECIDPCIIIRKYDSYAAFLQKYEKDLNLSFNKQQLNYLKFISQKLGMGKRRDDLEVLKHLITNYISRRTYHRQCREEHAIHTRASVANVLSGKYSTAGMSLISITDEGTLLDDTFASYLSDEVFCMYVLDVIDFGISRNNRDYSNVYKDTDFVLYAKYTREEICRFLGWEKEPNYQNVGGYFYDETTNTFPVFINYKKDPSKISITTMYEDRFLSDHEIIAISKSNRTTSSPEIVRLSHAQENGVRCYLFIRKAVNDKDGTTEFYFLGEMYPTGQFTQITMLGTTASAVEIGYRLETPVRADLYDYFLSEINEK